MRTLFFLFIFFVVSSCASSPQYNSGRPDSNYMFSVLQGSTDETSTVLRLVYPNYLKPLMKVTDNTGKNVPITEIKEFKNKVYEFKSVHLILKHLNPEKIYHLSLTTPSGDWSDTRTFKTLKVKDNLRVLVASCSSDQFNDIGNIIWPEAFDKNPNVVFLIGDNIYADIYSGIYIGHNIPSTPDHLWRRHVDHAMTMKIYRMKELVPTFVTWDDHDYGLNDGDGSYKHKEESKKIFQAFFPTYDTKNQVKTIGVGSRLNLIGQQFNFLDGRSFRSPRKDKNGFHLGKKQREMLLATVKQSKSINWLIMGDQFFGGYHPYESFEGLHPVEFQKFKEELMETHKKFVFLSGDRHFIEVMKAKEFNSIEYTVSGVHTKTYKGALARDPNPNRLDGFDGQYNYGIFDIQADGHIRFRAYTVGKKLIDRVDTI